MSRDRMNYHTMMERALRGVIREALGQVAESGLPGDHHFYITFDTNHPGVQIPPHLHARFPKEMTIVMQHQYWGLDVRDDLFAVTLSFSDMQERLVVPYEAVTAFADPSVQFGLQFSHDAEAAGDTAAKPALPAKPDAAPAAAKNPEPAAEDAATAPDAGGDNVIPLDSFRKK